MSTVTVDYYGVTGTGRNVTEAKRDAGAKIQFFMRNRQPKIFAYRGHAVVVWSDDESDCYSTIYPDSDGQRSYTATCHTGHAVDSAIRHLLTNARQIGEYDIPVWANGLIDAKDLIGDWKRSDAFTRAYRHAETLPADQLPSGGCHQWACDHMHDAQFVG